MFNFKVCVTTLENEIWWVKSVLTEQEVFGVAAEALLFACA